MKLTVNGKTHTLELEPEMPLLWVLRDELNLSGTKFGCGMVSVQARHLEGGGLNRGC